MADPEEADAHLSIAESYLIELLARAQDLAELKVGLYALYLAGKAGAPGVPLEALEAPEVIRTTVGLNSPEPAEQRLRRTLDRAVANGFLLRLMVSRGAERHPYYLPATRENRALLDRLRVEDPEALRWLNLPSDAELTVYRPNVFALYEQHIGPLTPLVAEHLRDAERSYPRAWIEEAILTAVQYNRRSWRYVEAILSRWEEAGGPAGVSGRRA